MKLLLSVVFVAVAGLTVSCGLFGGNSANSNETVQSEAGPVEGGAEAGVETGVTDGGAKGIPGAKTFNVRFEKGKTSKDYEDSVSTGASHTYLLGSSKGQLMKVQIASQENVAMFTVFDPVGNKLSDGEAGNTVFERVLPADGNYKIVVSPTKGAAKYKIGFSIAAKESADVEDESSTTLGGLTTIVRFGKGKSSVTYEDAVIRAERNTYVLGANAGQTMNVEITSLEDNAVFQISGPGGYLPGAKPGEDTKRWSGKLPANGKYSVIVGGTRGNATYKVSFSIK